MVKQSEPQFHRLHQLQESNSSAGPNLFLNQVSPLPSMNWMFSYFRAFRTSVAGDESSIARSQVDL